MTTLHFLNGPRAGETVTLTEGTWSVGRSPDNAVVIGDPSVSARHAELLVSPGEVIIRDLQSSNGTQVEERRVATQHPVYSGQRARLGKVEFRVTYGLNSASDDATDATASFALRRPEEVTVPAEPAPASAGMVEVNSTELGTQITTSRNRTPGPPAPTPVTPVRGPSPRPWPWLVAGTVVLALAVWWLLR